ncbi:MAG: hypothetical protein RLO52_12955 [Sandaracinaceae bacterium]
MRHLVLIPAVLIFACAPDAPASRRDSGARPAPVDDAGPAASQDSGVMPSGPTDAGPPSFEECAAQTTMAETLLQPVDIVWVVDRSGSMRGEADIVQENINNFAGAIGASGIDYHVVMVSAMEFVRVPPPLGSDASRFLYVEENVQSNDGLIALVNRFDSYREFLRPSAATHFVVVTDDESERMGWMDFQTQMGALLGHSFTFHSIASPPGSDHCVPPGFCIARQDGCTGPNGDAADNGDEYWSLSMATGGQRFSICTEDWSALFSSLTSAIAVATPLPCRFVVPPPPDGMSLDRMKVNVVYTPSGGGGQQVVPFVGGFSGCVGQGWYYEDDDIVVCPATCTTLTGDASGRVDIALGCETVLF